MTKKEFLLFAEKLNLTYPGHQFLVTPGRVDWWYELLGDLPYEMAMQALKTHSMTSKLPPTVADIREIAAAPAKTYPEPDEAWGQVSRAVRYYGYPRAKEAMNSLSEPVRKTVRDIGFQNICSSPLNQTNTLRAQFRRAYEAECRRMRQAEQSAGISVTKIK